MNFEKIKRQFVNFLNAEDPLKVEHDAIIRKISTGSNLPTDERIGLLNHASVLETQRMAMINRLFGIELTIPVDPEKVAEANIESLDRCIFEARTQQEKWNFGVQKNNWRNTLNALNSQKKEK